MKCVKGQKASLYPLAVDQLETYYDSHENNFTTENKFSGLMHEIDYKNVIGDKSRMSLRFTLPHLFPYSIYKIDFLT